MTHLIKKAARVLTIALAGSMLLVSVAFASETAEGVGCITGSSVRMRSAASTSSEIVMTLDKNAVVSVLSGSTNGWYRISFAGKTGYVSSDYLTVDQDGIFTAYGSVGGDGVNVRKTASTDSASVGTVDAGDPVTVTSYINGWYGVTCQYGTQGFIRSDLVNLTVSASEAASSSTGNQIVSTAKQYLGTHYVYGGASPSGFDCSGFTMYVYRQYGYSLPHTATGQWQSGVGTKVYSSSSLQTGDLVFFCDPSRSNGKACSHAGIYIGDGHFIHASSASSGGVVISSLRESYYSSYFVGGRHIA